VELSHINRSSPVFWDTVYNTAYMTEALSLKTSVYSRPFHSFIAAVNSGGAMTVLCASRVRPSVCLWSVVRPSHIIVPFILSKIKVCGFLGPCVMCLALQIFLSQSCTVSEILRLVQLAWRRTVTLNRTVVSEESSACQYRQRLRSQLAVASPRCWARGGWENDVCGHKITQKSHKFQCKYNKL